MAAPQGTLSVLIQATAETAPLTSTIEQVKTLGQQMTVASAVNPTAALEKGAPAARTALRDVAEATRAVGEASASAGQKIRDMASQGLATANQNISPLLPKIATLGVEIASFATGMGLLVTPMLMVGSHFGALGTLVAAGGAAFVMFSARAAGVRAAVHALSDALGLTALRTWAFSMAARGAGAAMAAVGSAGAVVRAGALAAAGGVRSLVASLSAIALRAAVFLPVLLPVLAVLAALYAAWKLVGAGIAAFKANLEAAETRLQNLASLEKLSHDGVQAAKALAVVQSAAADTGNSAANMTKAYTVLAGMKDAALLTGESLRAVAGIAKEAHKPVEEMAGKLKAVYDGVRQGGDEGRKATWNAIKALQDMGVFSDQARDKIYELQKAHADEGKILAVVRGEIAQYSGVAEKSIHTVAGEWARLKQQSADAMGQLLQPFAELRHRLEDLVATGIHKLADAIESLRARMRGGMPQAVSAVTEAVTSLWAGFTAVGSVLHAELIAPFDAASDVLRIGFVAACRAALEWLQSLGAEIRGGLKSYVDSLREAFHDAFAPVAGWIQPVIDKLIEAKNAVGDLLAKLGVVRGSASKAGVGGGVLGAGSGSTTGGGGSAGLYDRWSAEKARIEGEMYVAQEKREIDALIQREKDRKAGLARDAARAVGPKDFPEKDEKKKGGASERKQEVDAGAEAEKHWQMMLDLSAQKLALGESTQAQAMAENRAQTLDYIERLKRLQSEVPKTSEKFAEFEVRIRKAQVAIQQTTVWGQVSARLTKLRNDLANVGAQLSNTLGNLAETGLTTVGNSITAMITKTQNWRQVFAQGVQGMIGELAQLGTKIVAHYAMLAGQMVANAVLGTTLKTKDTAETAAQAATQTAALTPAAILKSIVTYGIAAAVGVAAFLAAMAITGSFDSGGYTGSGPRGGVAGVVHNREVVWSEADVDRWGGPGVVDWMRSVNPTTRTAGISPSGSGGRPLAQAGTLSRRREREAATVNVAILRDDHQFRQWQESSRGQKVLINQVLRNRGRMGIRT